MRTCPHCGGTQPSTFDAFCTHCGKLLDERLENDSIQSAENAGRYHARTASVPEQANTDEEQPGDYPPPIIQRRCSRCRSGRIIDNVALVDWEGRSISIRVDGDPSALVFRDSAYAIPKARVCGECGFVDFYVDDSHALLETALRAPEHYGLTPVNPPPPDAVCLSCGAVLPEDAAKCPTCGWSYLPSENP